jgi:hypothetical protein
MDLETLQLLPAGTGETRFLLRRIALRRTKIRTFIDEETELLTVLYIPFRVRTPKNDPLEIALTAPKQSLSGRTAF